MRDPERFWMNRLRWRLRGATQWPTFVVLTLLDGLALDLLPPLFTTGFDYIQGVLIATFANLFLLAAAAPFLARRMAARQAQIAGLDEAPRAARELLSDRVATALLVLGLFATVASGLANRPVVVSATKASERNADLVRDYIESSGDVDLQRNLQTANTIRLGEGYFRTCITKDDRVHRTCLLVDTRRKPATIRRDPSGESNERIQPTQ